MIKASGRTVDGTPVLMMGLSGENIARLMNGEPITFDTADLGLPQLRIVVLGGRTEADIAISIRSNFRIDDEDPWVIS